MFTAKPTALGILQNVRGLPTRRILVHVDPHCVGNHLLQTDAVDFSYHRKF